MASSASFCDNVNTLAEGFSPARPEPRAKQIALAMTEEGADEQISVVKRVLTCPHGRLRRREQSRGGLRLEARLAAGG